MLWWLNLIITYKKKTSKYTQWKAQQNTSHIIMLWKDLAFNFSETFDSNKRQIIYQIKMN